jgi:drug/metabolite transporter (DMT)-like permease
MVLAFLLIGERLTTVQWAGGALLIIILVLMARDSGMRIAEGNTPLEWRNNN